MAEEEVEVDSNDVTSTEASNSKETGPAKGKKSDSLLL
jgi:hypothetical protein